MNFLGIGSQPSVKINVDGLQKRKQLTMKYDQNNNGIKMPIYSGNDNITGNVDVKMDKCKKFEHLGIKLELIGQIETVSNKQQQVSDFMTMSKELEPQGILTMDKNYSFSFNNFEKQYESYYGKTIKLRYFLRVFINKKYNAVKEEFEFGVLLPSTEEDVDQINPLKMEVGIEDCLHIEFQYNKGKYYLKDCVTGRVNFALVKINLKYMQLDIIKRETIGQGSQSSLDNETIAKYEVMDGCPKKDEHIPIRLYLGGYDLSPTMKNIANKFNVKYFLNLVLVDEDDRRYFKQQEIQIFRKKI